MDFFVKFQSNRVWQIYIIHIIVIIVTNQSEFQFKKLTLFGDN